jgi:hypothetical protein
LPPLSRRDFPSPCGGLMTPPSHARRPSGFEASVVASVPERSYPLRIVIPAKAGIHSEQTFSWIDGFPLSQE